MLLPRYALMPGGRFFPIRDVVTAAGLAVRTEGIQVVRICVVLSGIDVLILIAPRIQWNLRQERSRPVSRIVRGFHDQGTQPLGRGGITTNSDLKGIQGCRKVPLYLSLGCLHLGSVTSLWGAVHKRNRQQRKGDDSKYNHNIGPTIPRTGPKQLQFCVCPPTDTWLP